MNYHELKQLVARGEGPSLEFKHKIYSEEKIAKEIVAFANTKGGELLIGIDDDGSIYGLKYADEEIYQLEKLIAKYIRFPVEYTISKIAKNSKKDVLRIIIKEAAIKPNFFIEDLQKRKGKAYIRVEDKCIQASREMVKILKLQSKNADFSFSYGRNEKMLLRLLREHETLSLKSFAEMAMINTDQASYTLVKLVYANVLHILPGEKEDLYAFKEDSRSD